MQELTTINNAEILVKEFSGQRVVTFKDIDAVHGRPDGTAKRNFRSNREHFIEGEDFFMLDQPDEIRSLGIQRPQGGTPESVTLITTAFDPAEKPYESGGRYRHAMQSRHETYHHFSGQKAPFHLHRHSAPPDAGIYRRRERLTAPTKRFYTLLHTFRRKTDYVDCERYCIPAPIRRVQ